MDDKTARNIVSCRCLKIVDRTMKRLDLDIDDLVDRYLAGESQKHLADSLGVGRPAIYRRLVESGTPIRGRSEAETVKWSRMTADQRTAQTAAAHDASRGRTVTVDERVRVANTKAANWPRFITADEQKLADWLTDRGVVVVPQEAIHVYNCDLGAFPVAVEIFGGHWHWYGTHQRRLPERFRDFFDRGWHILVVHVTTDRRLVEDAADHIVSYYQTTRSNPTGRREYRMIRGGSKPMLVCTEDDEIPDVYPFDARRNPTTGRYESVPRET